MIDVERLQQADELLQQHGRPFPLPLGELTAVVAGCVSALRTRDWWVPGLRERAGGVLRGAPAERLLNPAAGAKPYRIAPCDGTPADRALHAVGLGMAGEHAALVHLGIGSCADGAFHEALNLASLHRADVVFAVAVHRLTDEAPIGTQLAADLCDLAAAHDIPYLTVDGRSSEAVHSIVANALEKGGPHVLEFHLEQNS